MHAGTSYKLVKDLPYREGLVEDAYAAERCRLDVYHPADSRDFVTLVWLYGGGLTSGERHLPEGLKEQGVALVTPDYRLSPRAKAPAYIDDAAAAVAWTFRHIGEFGGHPDRLVVAGASAGAYLAALITLDPGWLARYGIDARRIAGLAALTAQMITHFTVRQERGIPPERAVIDEWAPFFHVRADAPPMLLTTGDRELELFGRFEENAYFLRMLTLAGHKDHELLELKGYDHGGVEGASLPHLLRFIREKITPRTAR